MNVVGVEMNVVGAKNNPGNGSPRLTAGYSLV
jgi:hypothetical protein